MKKNILFFAGILIVFVFVVTTGNAQIERPGNSKPKNVPCNYLCNGDFESLNVPPPPIVTGGVIQPTIVNAVPCWQNTAENCVEIWRGGTIQTVPAYTGNQFAELNCTLAGSLYQIFSATAGTTVTVSFAHRGRAGRGGGGTGSFFDNQMVVSIGPDGGSYVPLITCTGSTTAWTPYSSLTYYCSSTGNYRLSFTSLTGTSYDESGGNFLDAITVTSDCPAQTFNPCCPPLDTTKLKEMMHYDGSGGISSDYTLHFQPTPAFEAQMQAYFNYLQLACNPAITQLVINWRLNDQGILTNPSLGNGPQIDDEAFTVWDNTTNGTGGVPHFSSLFFNSPSTYPMHVNRWYMVNTGLYLMPYGITCGDGNNCPAAKIYVRVLVQGGVKGNGAVLQFSDGKKITKAVPIKSGNKLN